MYNHKHKMLEAQADKLLKKSEISQVSIKDKMIFDILSKLLLGDFYLVRSIHRQLIKSKHEQV